MSMGFRNIPRPRGGGTPLLDYMRGKSRVWRKQQKTPGLSVGGWFPCEGFAFYGVGPKPAVSSFLRHSPRAVFNAPEMLDCVEFRPSVLVDFVLPDVGNAVLGGDRNAERAEPGARGGGDKQIMKKESTCLGLQLNCKYFGL